LLAVTGTTAFAAALICRYSYGAPRRKQGASENRAGSQNRPGTPAGSQAASATRLRVGAYNRLMFIEDDKLPDDVVRKKHSDIRHALCCLDCGFESEFNPTVQGAIGRPLQALVMHDCKQHGD
jgi:hypothetical protein